jgi:hypothetical protein
VNEFIKPKSSFTATVENQFDAQFFEQKANDFVRILEANQNIMQRLREFYDWLLNHKHFELDSIPPSPACRSAVDDFSAEIESMLDEFKRDLSRARNIAKEASEMKSLVWRTFSTLLVEIANNK